jgi:hypothetical protein
VLVHAAAAQRGVLIPGGHCNAIVPRGQNSRNWAQILYEGSSPES